MPVDWSDGMPTEADVEEADDMSVKASYEITPEQAASDDPWEAVFYVRMQEGTNYSQDHMLGVVETKDGNAVKGNYSGAVDGVSVLPMYATASESVSVTDAQGGYRSAARPGDTLDTDCPRTSRTSRSTTASRRGSRPARTRGSPGSGCPSTRPTSGT